MITQSGVHIQKMGEVEGIPTIEDIAVQAGRICRYGGAIWNPLLPHLVFVGMLASRRNANYNTTAWAFLHDAHEIVTGEVPRPFKCDCMRREQKAIDDRLIAAFGLSKSEIDFDLIKQCDIDACHIEAVELGLPGFADTEIRYSANYTKSREIYTSPESVALFHGILRSPFYYADITEGATVCGVEHFIELLKIIDSNSQTALTEKIASWEAWLTRDHEKLSGLALPKELDFRGTEECRNAIYKLTNLMDKYDLPQVIVNRKERMKVSVVFHTQESHANAVAELEEEMEKMFIDNPDIWKRLPNGKYQLIDPLEIEVLEAE